MALQIADALIEALNVGHQGHHFALDHPRRLFHMDVFQHRAHGIEGGPQRGRRDDEHLGAIGFVDDVSKVGMKLGVDGFRRQEHQGGFCSFAG